MAVFLMKSLRECDIVFIFVVIKIIKSSVTLLSSSVATLHSSFTSSLSKCVAVYRGRRETLHSYTSSNPIQHISDIYYHFILRKNIEPLRGSFKKNFFDPRVKTRGYYYRCFVPTGQRQYLIIKEPPT